MGEESVDTVAEFRSKLPGDQELRMACLELAMAISHGKTAEEAIKDAKVFEDYVVKGN